MLRFDQIDTQEKLDNWKQFADSFDHATDKPLLPIITISNEKGMFADYTVFTRPVLFPAFHPERTSPRMFKETVDIVSHAYCLSSMSPQFPNGVCHIALPRESKIVSSGMIDKFGFNDMNASLYQRLG